MQASAGPDSTLRPPANFSPAVPNTPPAAPVKIYNAVYSSVQVYECMIRGIAVMRRRADSFVNATQILKVAGVDKGRRTKILEKEILPGKHEIVQGGYGKYQGTWIPLDRGRDIAHQYGVLPLLAPLFDFTPSTNSLQALPMSTPGNLGVPRPLSASSSYGSYLPGVLAPPPIMPGSALRLLNQGRAQGLFTPSTSAAHGSPGVTTRFTQVSPIPGQSRSPFSPASAAPTPPPPSSSHSLKRPRSNPDAPGTFAITPVGLADVQMADINDEGPSPTKRPRTESEPQPHHPPPPPSTAPSGTGTRPSSTSSTIHGGTAGTGTDPVHTVRFATKPTLPRNVDPSAPLKDTRRAAVIASIYQSDDPIAVLTLLRDIAHFPANSNGVPRSNAHSSENFPTIDVDTILDEQGHNALHLASSLSRLSTVHALISQGADLFRGNHLGETPLMRTILSTHAYSAQSLSVLLQAGLSRTILTLDTSRKSVLHHIVSLAGVKGRAAVARYYLDQILLWIAEKMGGDIDFGKIVDLQDEHGDTALNVAARVGNRVMVRTLIDVGANKTLGNKLGLRPGDFGVETEELSVGQKAEDIMQMYRPAVPAPVQKSQDVIADMTALITSLATDFQAEIKVKQDSLDVTQAHLRAATRELAEQRKQIFMWQGRVRDKEVVEGRRKNLERAIRGLEMTRDGIKDEKGDANDWEQGLGRWDWTGRLGPNDEPRFVEGHKKSDKENQSGKGDKDDEMDVDADGSADDDFEAGGSEGVGSGSLPRTLSQINSQVEGTGQDLMGTPMMTTSMTAPMPDSAVSPSNNGTLITPTPVTEVPPSTTTTIAASTASLPPSSLQPESHISPAFRYRGVSANVPSLGPYSASFSNSSSLLSPSTTLFTSPDDTDPPLPTTNTPESLIRLRRLHMWTLRLEGILLSKLEGMRGASAEKEYMCRRIVSLCTGVEVGMVDGMLDNLVIAMESEANIVDIGRVSGFMQKVRDGII